MLYVACSFFFLLTYHVIHLGYDFDCAYGHDYDCGYDHDYDCGCSCDCARGLDHVFANEQCPPSGNVR
jgi:hypothetical protein